MEKNCLAALSKIKKLEITFFTLRKFVYECIVSLSYLPGQILRLCARCSSLSTDTADEFCVGTRNASC
jgi:hypothetical protein